MATEIEEDARAVLAAAVDARDAANAAGNVDQVSEYIRGDEIAARLGISAPRINDAVSLLEISGYLDVVRTFGNAPFDFREVAATPLGRLEHQKARLAVADDMTQQSPTTTPLPRPSVPVGSPYGFQVQDYEYIERQRARRDVLKVVFGYQFQSKVFDRGQLTRMLRKDFRSAVDAYNAEPGHETVVLEFQPLRAGYGEHLFNEIARDVISADIAVFETSDRNSNVMIELGVALTWGIRILPIKKRGRRKPPSDISGQTWADYDVAPYRFVADDHHDLLVGMVRRAARSKGGTGTE